LKSLSVSCWRSSSNHSQAELTELNALSSLTNLESLELGYLESLTDLDPLSGLVELTRLKLVMCGSLKALTPLSKLYKLTSLDLTGAKSLSDLKPLTWLSKLEVIILKACPRVRSLRPLRYCKNLATLESDLHPAFATGVLARASMARQDMIQIKAKARSWMEELNASVGDHFKAGQWIAYDLAGAFSLLDESSIGTEFRECLRNHFPLDADPWEAWFRGNLRAHGFDVYRSQIESLDIIGLPPGAIGGICKTIAETTLSTIHQRIDLDWARQWLASLEQGWMTKASEIESAAHYICAALDALGEHQSLERWKVRFARDCDVSVMDSIYCFLSYPHYSDVGSGKAEAHVLMIEDDKKRDSMLSSIIKNYCWSGDANRALNLLLQMGEQKSRNNLAVEMSGSSCFSSNLDNMRSLLAAAGDSPQIIARILRNMKISNADSEIAQLLSAEMAADEDQLNRMRRKRLEKLLVEMA